MNKQMAKDIKRREKAEKKAQRKRKMPTYKGYSPSHLIFYPLMVVSVEIDLFFENLFRWNEEKGRKFMEKNWMQVMDFLPEDEEWGACYYYDFGWGSGIWERGGKTPFGHRWGRRNGFHIVEILKGGWCPDGFKRVMGHSYGEDYALFIPEKN